ncbi:MAG: SUMF1/EgtB/PvdO family nonheme iron enzyme [Polyangiaceae bacterium]
MRTSPLRRLLDFALILSGLTLFSAEPNAHAAPAGQLLQAQLGRYGASVTALTVTRHSVTAQKPHTPDAPVTASSACPGDMVLVEGSYCTEVRHECKKWLDDPKLPYARCQEYEPSARCVGQRVPMHYCIDRTEYTKPGEKLPLNWQSFSSGAKVCKSLGKRLCTESEWNFACEGEEMRPYPYGWSREPKCNQDRDDLYENNPRKQILKDNRMSAEELAECVSPFGVVNMAGNLDEPVLRENARFNPPYRNGLKGGWWMAARNRCRPATTKHDDYYNDIQVGVRCCAEAPGTAAPTG